MATGARSARKVFIGWSGKRSGAIAGALRYWLSCFSTELVPWISNSDLIPGRRWANDLTENLGSTKAGILCVNRENMCSPWLNFEAGALSRSVESAVVIPYLIDVDVEQLEGPLALFQAVPATRDATKNMLTKLLAALRIDVNIEWRMYDAFWPLLDEALKATGTETDSVMEKIRKISIAMHSTVLEEVTFEPATVRPGETLTVKYYVDSKVHDVPVWLGCAIVADRGKWTFDTTQDKAVVLQYGSYQYERQLTIPGAFPAGEYKINFDMWFGPVSDSVNSYPFQHIWPAERKVRIR